MTEDADRERTAGGDVVDAGTGMLVAVPAALLGAAGFGLASAAQMRATHEVEVAPTLSPKLIVDLVPRPMWLLGLVATAVALPLQLVALAFGPIAVVQPLLVTGCAFAAGFSAVLARHRPDPVIIAGALCTAAGLATFLLAARPTPAGGEHVDAGGALPLAVALGAVILGCLAYAATVAHPSRVLALALATGMLFGVTAGLLKVVMTDLRDGLPAVAAHPAIYVVCVIGPIGFLLSQNTFQQGRMIAPAIAVISTADPVVGVLIGVHWLGERLATTPARLAGECVAAVVVIGGITLVTMRGTHLLRVADRPDAEDPRPRSVRQAVRRPS